MTIIEITNITFGLSEIEQPFKNYTSYSTLTVTLIQLPAIMYSVDLGGGVLRAL